MLVSHSKNKIMKIYVFGYRGMLGRYVYIYLKSNGHNVIGVSRDVIDAEAFNEIQLKSALFQKGFKRGDIIINCMGVIKSQIDKAGTLSAIKVNSLFPHYLSNICKKDGYKMIHVSTDCAYSGKDGLYNENSLHDCTDIYGKTKSLGEPSNCTVVRTSIIGEEIGQARSLIEWVKSMSGNTVNGFINHHWNGLTCLQLAKIFEFIILNNHYWDGVRHIFSPEIVTKNELVKMISDVHGLNVQVTPIEADISCDRSLSTIYNDIDFNIPPIKEQIEEQHNYFNKI